ncbi:retron system putative HNH endonuclease [Chryseobacterium sp. Marseille-Q3244]|uniref:retron system putative HNH endonuclease n=1 Tax=Chryseobacterium sp. Marseille-Q3244 TaxID=2758092 RepID=UPI0020255764|nr:retron system putative HNH endonuclease [Chryseobacterium sp. Marseille-Q3244]
MAIRQYHFKLRYPNRYSKIIQFLKPLKGNEWDCKAENFRKYKRGLYSRRNELKSIIRQQLERLQGDNCAFCGLSLKSRVTQIEHIAPKGKILYPQFMFEPKNLILACSLCNGFDKKHTFNTIKTVNAIYNRCTFNIVHPYFDNPDDHLEYFLDPESNLAFIIQVREINGVKSSKGLQTVSLFELDSNEMTQERYKDALAASQPVQPDFEKLIAEVKQREYVSKS